MPIDMNTWSSASSAKVGAGATASIVVVFSGFGARQIPYQSYMDLDGIVLLQDYSHTKERIKWRGVDVEEKSKRCKTREKPCSPEQGSVVRLVRIATKEEGIEPRRNAQPNLLISGMWLPTRPWALFWCSGATKSAKTCLIKHLQKILLGFPGQPPSSLNHPTKNNYNSKSTYNSTKNYRISKSQSEK
jgi:hypothetical protein